MASLAQIEKYLGELRSLSSSWVQNKVSVQQQVQYLHAVQAIEELLSYNACSHTAVDALIAKGICQQIVSAAIEHCLKGLLPWITVKAWERTVDHLLRLTHRASSYSHLIAPLYDIIAKLVKDRHGSSPTVVPATCAGLCMLRLLLTYSPIEMKNAFRKHLPHPVKNISVAARVEGFKAVPWVIANLPLPPAPPTPTTSSSSSHAGGANNSNTAHILNAEFYEYLRKGVTSSDYTVCESAVTAVRRTLELGVGIDAVKCMHLFDMLIAACQIGAYSTRQSTEEDAGVAMGYLLAHCQTGFAHGSICSYLKKEDPSAIQWEFFGGVEAMDAGRVVRKLFNPNMSRAVQQALSGAIQTLFKLCVVPTTMARALRCIFVLLVPISTDKREYMPQLVSHALTSWAVKLPQNSHRLALVCCLQDYVKRTEEAKSIVHTALHCIREIMPMLASSRELVKGLEKDMIQVLDVQPTLWNPISDVYTHLVVQNPYLQSKLRIAFMRPAASTQSGGGDGRGSGSQQLPRNLRFKVKTLISLLPRLSNPEVFVDPLLSTTLQMGSVEIPSTVSEGSLQVVEHFFYLAKALFEHFSTMLTPFIKDRLDLSILRFSTLLVSNAPPSANYCRAASAACELFLLGEGATPTQKTLCIGMLEGALLSSSEYMEKSAAVHLYRLKKDVYRVVSSHSWPDCKDEGSLRWLVTRALNDLEAACDTGAVVSLNDTDLFPSNVSVLLRRTRCMIPNPVELPCSESVKEAATLVAWGMRHFAVSDISFCHDILRRIGSFMQLDASPSKSVIAAGQTRDWNVMCVMLAILSGTRRDDRLSRKLWRTKFTEVSETWETLARRCAVSSVFDVRVLASKVLGILLGLTGRIDTVVAGMLQGSRDADLMLALAEAHVVHHKLEGAPASTLPLALSLLTGDLKRTSPLGDPCTMHATMLLMSYVVLARKYPTDTRVSVMNVLVPALLVPAPVAIDPIVMDLLLLLFSVIPLTATAAAEKQSGLKDVVNHAVRQAVYWRQYTRTSQEESAAVVLATADRVLRANARATDLTQSHDANTFTVLLIRIREQLLASLALSLSPSGGRNRNGSSNAVTLIMPNSLPDSITKGLASLTVMGLEDADFSGFKPAKLTLTQLSALIDSAVTEEARSAWWSVGEVLLRQASSAVSPREMHAYMEEMQSILTARPPDLSLARESAAAAVNNSPHDEDVGGGGCGYGVEEGAENFLSNEMGSGAASPTSKARRAGLIGCDIASKHFIFHLVKYIIRLRLQDVQMQRTAIKMSLVAVSLVEAAPELMAPAIDIMLDLLDLFHCSDSPVKARGALLEWKTQLAANVKSVVQLCVFNVEKGCELINAFMRSSLADDGTMRRAVRGLSVLLGTLDHMSHQITGSSSITSVGLVVLELGDVVRFARSHNWVETGKTATQSIQSSAGQTALSMLCSRLITTVAVASGFESPAALTPPGYLLDDTPGRCGDAAQVLWTVAESCRGRSDLGPGLRYAAGCLACIVIAAVETDLEMLPRLIEKLSGPHQVIMVEAAYRTLMDKAPSQELNEPELHLLNIISRAAAVTKSPKIVSELEGVLLPRGQHVSKLSAVQVADLLIILLEGSGSLSSVLFLLRRLHVDYMCAAPEPLIQAGRTYLRAYRGDATRVFTIIAESSPEGLILSERISAASDLAEGYESALRATPLPRTVTYCLTDALQASDDPMELLTRLCPSGSSLSRVGVFVCTMGSITDAALFIKCSPALCHLLRLMLNGDVFGATVEGSMRAALQTLTSLLLDIPQADVAQRVLRPVGVHIMKVVAKSQSAVLRNVIKEIGPERGASLRTFMEQSLAP